MGVARRPTIECLVVVHQLSARRLSRRVDQHLERDAQLPHNVRGRLGKVVAGDEEAAHLLGVAGTFGDAGAKHAPSAGPADAVPQNLAAGQMQLIKDKHAQGDKRNNAGVHFGENE